MSTCFLFLHLFTPKLCKKMSICFHVSIFSPPDIRMGENLLPYTLNPPYSLLHTPTPPSQYFLPVTLYLLFYAPLLLHTYLSTAHFPQLHFHHPVSPSTGKWFNIGGSVLTTIYLLPTHYHQNISPNIFPFKDPPCVLEIFL